MKNTDLVQLLRELANELHQYDSANPYHDAAPLIARARQAAEEIEGREVPMLELVVRPCGRCWLQINAPSGRQAAINLGPRGSFHDQTYIGSVIFEVAELTSFGGGEG